MQSNNAEVIDYAKGNESRRRIGPKALIEINEARLAIGLRPIKMKQRKCLKCGSSFQSLGERTCGCLARVSTSGLIDAGMHGEAVIYA